MTKSFTVSDKIKDQIISEYKEFEIKPPKYSIFAAKTPNFNIIVYNSLKVVISGKDIEEVASKWLDFTPFYKANIIGSDEVGNGDYFGPIVVCSVYVGNRAVEILKALDVRDSKNLNDDQIIQTARKLMEVVEYKLVTLSNEKYNQLISKGYNIKSIMAIMHHKAIKELDKRCEVFIDQFSEKYLFERYVGDNVEYNFLTKGESHYVAIAAASIIARAKFVSLMNKLESELKTYINDFKIPYGAGAKVDFAAKILYDVIGKRKLEKFVKIDFSNTKRLEETYEK